MVTWFLFIQVEYMPYREKKRKKKERGFQLYQLNHCLCAVMCVFFSRQWGQQSISWDKTLKLRGKNEITENNQANYLQYQVFSVTVTVVWGLMLLNCTCNFERKKKKIELQWWPQTYNVGNWSDLRNFKMRRTVEQNCIDFFFFLCVTRPDTTLYTMVREQFK